MNYLENKIEKKIKKLNERFEKDSLNDGCITQRRIIDLEWLLSELKKMNCLNCISKERCSMRIELTYKLQSINFCSNFEEVDK